MSSGAGSSDMHPRVTTTRPAAPAAAPTPTPEQGEAHGCLICLDDVEGAARDRPGHGVTSGGWGFTNCCSHPAHFECLGAWLNPFEADGARKSVESSHGAVPLNCACPVCKASVSRSASRMLSGESKRASTGRK